jgi:hypothetical protein
VRTVVDVLVERPGQLGVEHNTPDRAYRLATLTVSKERASPSAGQFEVLRRASELAAERQGLERLAGRCTEQGAGHGRPETIALPMPVPSVVMITRPG